MRDVPHPDAEPTPPAETAPASERPVPDPLPADPDAPERRKLESEPSTRCLNCGCSLPGAYCPECGQKDQALRTPIHRFVVDTLAEYLGLDGRVWPTLGTLMVKPGRLTQAYVLGRRQQYVRPLRIYLTASLAFFFILALIDPLGRLNPEFGSPGDLPSDTTMTAGAYLAHLDSLLQAEAEEDRQQVALVDSLEAQLASMETAFAADSAAGRFADLDSLDAATDALDDLRDDLEDERGDYEQMRSSTNDRRLAWRREQTSRYRPDSTILPSDLVLASELAVDGDDDRGTNIDGPEWLLGGEQMERIREARTREERNRAGIALGKAAIGHLPTVIFLLLPVFALLMKVLHIRRGWYYAEHLVFALHTHAFAFVVFAVLAVVLWASGNASWANTLTWVLSLAIPVYFVLAMKRVYNQGWIKTLFKVCLLGWMYFFVLLGGTVVAAGLAAALG